MNGYTKSEPKLLLVGEAWPPKEEGWPFRRNFTSECFDIGLALAGIGLEIVPVHYGRLMRREGERPVLEGEGYWVFRRCEGHGSVIPVGGLMKRGDVYYALGVLGESGMRTTNLIGTKSALLEAYPLLPENPLSSSPFHDLQAQLDGLEGLDIGMCLAVERNVSQ